MSDLIERFERGMSVADKHEMDDPLLALGVKKALEAVDAGANTRTAAFDLAASSAVEAHANGKSPTLVGAAIVYESGMAAENTHEHTQREVSQAIESDRETVGSHCRQLRSALDTDAPTTATDAPRTG